MGGTIFAVGLFVFLLLIGGLIFTVVEFNRLQRTEPKKRGGSSFSPGPSA